MKVGMISLDLLVSIIGLLMVGGALASLGFIQAENSVANSLKFKAESMAMAIGSAINHFDAINPEDGSKLVLNLSNPEPISSDILTSGWPPVGRVSFDSCNISFSGGSGSPAYVLVNISFYRWDSGTEDFVVGKYPLVTSINLASTDTVNCSGTIVVDNNMNVWLHED